MNGTGRPLRFLVAVVGGWTMLRVAMLWPGEPARDVARGKPATPSAPIVAAAGAVALASLPRFPGAVAPGQPVTPADGSRARRRQPISSAAAAPAVQAELFPPQIASPLPPGPARRADRHRAQPSETSASSSRFSGSVWAILRAGPATPFATQLGGSQAGVRLLYALGESRRLAIAARASTALRTRQQEGAVGIDWQPTRLPIHLVAEQRIGIANTRGGPAVGVIAGHGPAPIAGDVTLEAYVQGGAIARDGVEGYVDGALRLALPVAALGPARIDLGLGAWGGAQRGAALLDAGPSLAVRAPLGGRSVRLSLEWRQRVAGAAAPVSGPALSLGTDF